MQKLICFIFAAFVLGLAHGPANAQETQAEKSTEQAQPGGPTDNVTGEPREPDSHTSDKPPEEISEAERLVSLERTIEADKMWTVRREMLHRIKNKFDDLGIRIPLPHRVVLQPQEDPNR